MVKISFSDDELILDFSDGRSQSVLLSWYPRLFHATPAERDNWLILGDGYVIEWPDLDEHIA